MNRIRSLTLPATLATVLLVTGWAAGQTPSQSADPQPAQKPSAEQQKQPDQVKQLQEQLRKDREAVHAAITQHGWDSDQTDAARNQLFRDRQEYRQIRRSLRAAGVEVAPPTGLGRRGRAFRRWTARGGPWGGAWRHHARPMRNCPCCGW